MAKEILTRIGLKIDTLAKWNESTIGLYAGELAIATVAAGEGHGLSEPVIMIKIGEDGVKTFKELPWALHAKASDVYSWAKQSETEFVASFFGMKNTEGNTLEQILDSKFATNGELAADVATLRGELTAALAGYYTKAEIDGMIGDLDVGAIEGRVDDLETAVNTTLPGQIGAVDAKFTEYTKTADLPKDLGDFTNNAGYAKTADVNTTLEAYAKTTDLPTKVSELENDVPYLVAADIAGKADSTQVATDIAAAIAPLATTEALNGVKAIAEAAKTEDEVNSQIDAKVAALDLVNTYEAKGEAAKVSGALDEYKTANNAAVALKANAADVYTKTEADAEFMTQDEVDARVNKVITDAVDGDALTSLTELVQYINTHGGEAAEMATAIADIEKQLDGIDAGTGTVKKYVDDAVAALKIGDYAKAQDLVDLAARVKAIEDAPYATTANVATAKGEAVAAAKTETETQIAALNITQYETIEGAADKYEEKGVAQGLVDGLGIGDYMKTADAEAAYEKKGVAQGLVDGLNIAQYETITGAAGKYETIGTAQDIVDGLKLSETYEPIGAEGRAIAAAKTETETQIAALNIADYAKSADVANTYRAKADKITSDDMSDETWVFNCGTSSTVI